LKSFTLTVVIDHKGFAVKKKDIKKNQLPETIYAQLYAVNSEHPYVSTSMSAMEAVENAAEEETNGCVGVYELVKVVRFSIEKKVIESAK